MAMISLRDFEKPVGGVDWNAYRAAQVEAGERCSLCGAFILTIFANRLGPRQCADCRSLEGTSEVRHRAFLRCPDCGHSWDLRHRDCDVFEEGPHSVTCPVCSADFEIKTSIEFTFTSPEKKAGVL